MFQELISQKKQMGVKSFLMRQDVLCGIGNVYSDEICYQAGLHPKKKIAQLGEDELKTFFESIKAVLETAIDCRANPEKLPDAFIIP
jgi:formamidopyrimidine-DNA glycosylase